MLTEIRHELILDYLNKKGFVKLAELITLTNTSESTIRRDLSYLESKQALKRVHGGAKLIDNLGKELSYFEKSSKNIQTKHLIAKYASNMVTDNDFIFLDAGTTTYEMISFLKDKKIFVVTNGLKHIDALIDNDIPCYMVGGKVKLTTKAVIGSDAFKCLNKFKFDKCFLGTNGVDNKFGFTTPDPEEAIIKECAISKSKQAYVLADYSKFSKSSFMKFAELDECTIITNHKPCKKTYDKITDIKVVDN
ncbi:DeoR/GlpR family DNA-binding transcription regulator [Clostridium tarantellae]|uniref:DeoR family transcriptional regulator n=1 Tax=Clostridium tarantellae TaxID=39493 RepID=A0A6I1MH81_9CLOT|nr:DeoR/GlpR family DNA-binding transcription regulator [Clostridium tarantellae]MPQ42735.1 DeoR family transcriptional regulator [Clostridium tarantellae]